MLCPVFVPGLGTCAGMEPVVHSPRAEDAELSQGTQPEGTGLPSLCEDWGLSSAKTGT